ncbi:DUF72 domain-containing protein [Nevskia sp.]|uniref:DUF72 domain-containing protein n=1 Tax=Nevskia sp. TaxID=1929292 RepID=UPI0025D78493|nr:DUF72 domain-containing protein [Nevskia sp.]
MQDSLFPEAPPPPAPAPRRKASTSVQPAEPRAEHQALAAALPKTLHLGTSSWTYPGWTGLVWAEDYPDAKLSKEGLRAYSQHPLMRAVSVDRAFYRPLTVSQYTAYALQVSDDFRFVIKAPSLVSDALVRDETGRGMTMNRNFLDPELAVREFVEPALAGLGHKLGALVFQLSPLPEAWLKRLDRVLDQLAAMLAALPSLLPAAADAVVAVEVRDPLFLQPPHAARLANLLRDAGATYCLGLHAKMPPIAEQLPMLRALWPRPLVCRWNLHRMHGAFGYEEAKQLYAPYDKLVDPDPETRSALVKVIAATTAAGHKAYVTISNKAEGSAPLTVEALAQAVLALQR